MIKRIIINLIAIIITIIVMIFGYYMIMDIETKIPQKANESCDIETKEFMSRKIFIIKPKTEQLSKKVILYFHGGAYVAEATTLHWDFLEKLANDTKSTIVMPDYPLTPKYTYKDVFNMVEPLYKEIISKVDAKNLVMMGDSAGGGITLALAEKISQNNIQLPSKTILISPWLNVTLTNEKIKEVQKNDKDLNKEKLLIAGISYARDEEGMKSYLVNPINGPLSKLKNVIIYTGTYDILNPDTHLLQEKAKKEGIDIQIKEYEQAPHIWIINNINKQDELQLKAYQDLVCDIQ
ncbi:alpha/beta hydrolase fold-3 domain protein [Clostridium sp. CAG:440]|nr:alpha/beta hydrolase fold-3 domain protein [Clostridium sp. CAG:440]